MSSKHNKGDHFKDIIDFREEFLIILKTFCLMEIRTKLEPTC